MKIKLLPVFLIIITLASLTVADLVFMSYRKERSQRITLEQEKDELIKNKKVLERQIDNDKKAISGLITKLNDADNQMKSLTVDMDNEKNAKTQALADLKTTKQELEYTQKTKTDLEAKFNKTQDELKDLQTKLKDLEDAKAQLETKLKEVKGAGEVKLDKIVVTSSPKEGQLPTTVEGRVLVINKDYDFIVISLGQSDGISIGDIVSIYHGDKLLGKASIEEIRPTLSVATLVNPGIKNKINEGDRVVKMQK